MRVSGIWGLGIRVPSYIRVQAPTKRLCKAHFVVAASEVLMCLSRLADAVVFVGDGWGGVRLRVFRRIIGFLPRGACSAIWV